MPSETEFDSDQAGAPLDGPAERQRLLRELRRMEPDLRRSGVRRLRLFGSVARGEAGPASDVDLLAEIDRSALAGFSLLDLIGIQHRIGDGLGRPVQILTAPHKLNPRLRAAIEADAIEVFVARA